MKVLQANQPAINSTVNVGIYYGITRVFHAKNITFARELRKESYRK